MQIGVDDLRQSYDLIIVGSGPAGLTLARRYDGLTTASRTLIMESGSRTNPDSEARQLSKVDASGDVGSNKYAHHSRRIFGGTSSIWNGWCAALEQRAFLNGEWPFTYDELQAYYPQAADILGLPREVGSHPETPFAGNANLVYRPYYVSSQRRFAVLYQDLLTRSNSVDVLFDHTVTNIDIKDGVASRLSIRKSLRGGGSSVEISGNTIVLACGGIQNARLLRLSLPQDNPLPIGTYFCQHPRIRRYGKIILDAEIFQETKIRPAPGYGIRHAIALSSDFSYSNRLPSVTFELRPSKPLPTGTGILGRKRRSVLQDIYVRAEMPSLERNIVALSSSRRDFLGQPIASIAFSFGQEMGRSIRTAYDHVNTELVRSGVGRLSVPREQSIHSGGGHMIGTTRMGSDPAVSVTDADARVHGLQNLYLAGSSLFPSAGAANPTLTILALSLRLADHLAGRLK